MDDESHHTGQIQDTGTEPELPPHTDTPDLDESLGHAEPLLKEVAETFDELAEVVENTPSPARMTPPVLPIPSEDLPGVSHHSFHVPKFALLGSNPDPIYVIKMGTLSWALITLLLLSLQSIGVISI